MRIPLPATLLAFAFLALAGPARAAGCTPAATQAQMNACAGASLAAADKALNATYARVMARLAGDKEGKQALVTAERAWVAFRDAQCGFETSAARGGSIRPMLAAICRARLTAERDQVLRAYLQCKEGDLSCPIPPR